MLRIDTRIEGINSADSIAAPALGPWYGKWRTRAIGLRTGLLGAVACLPLGGYAQTLDQAVNEQLAIGLSLSFSPLQCNRLLDGAECP